MGTFGRAAYFRYVAVFLLLIAGPGLLLEIGVLVWVRHNMAIGLVGMVGFTILIVGTVKRLGSMGLPKILLVAALLPYGLNLLFMVYLLSSTRTRRLPDRPRDLRDVR